MTTAQTDYGRPWYRLPAVWTVAAFLLAVMFVPSWAANRCGQAMWESLLYGDPGPVGRVACAIAGQR